MKGRVKKIESISKAWTYWLNTKTHGPIKIGNVNNDMNRRKHLTYTIDLLFELILGKKFINKQCCIEEQYKLCID